MQTCEYVWKYIKVAEVQTKRKTTPSRTEMLLLVDKLVQQIIITVIVATLTSEDKEVAWGGDDCKQHKWLLLLFAPLINVEEAV